MRAALRRGQNRLRYLGEVLEEEDPELKKEGDFNQPAGEEEDRETQQSKRRRQAGGYIGEDLRTPPKPPPGSFVEARWRTTPPSWPKDRGREIEDSDKGTGTVRSPDDSQGRTPVWIKVQRIAGKQEGEGATAFL